MKWQSVFSLFIFFSTVSILKAQTFSSILLDGETNLPIPYAAIVFGKEQGVITNEEGQFTFTMDRDTKSLDSIYISCMGYLKKGFTKKQLQDSILYLQPGGFNLEGVELLGQGLTADQIVQYMVDSIPINYTQLPVRKKFFLRQSTFDELDEARIVLKSSTMPEVNEIVIEDMMRRLPKKSEYHTETYGELFKSGDRVKLKVLKATEMYDKQKQATYNGLNHALKKILRQHVRGDSYFKIKTGPISTKMDLDTIIGRPELAENPNDSAETSIQLNYLANREKRLAKIEGQVFGKKSRLEVIEKRKNYLFFKEKTIKKDGERFYVISFEPKKNGRLAGKMFINTINFALVRIEYQNIKPLKGLNLLGVRYNEPLYEGVAEFSKMKNGKYELHFSSLKHNFFVKVRRPFKVAEKNKNTKGRRKQNEITLDLYLTAKSVNTFEWVALESKGSSQSTFEKVPQRKLVEVVYRTQYDDSYWEGMTIVSPTTIIKDFAILGK